MLIPLLLSSMNRRRRRIKVYKKDLVAFIFMVEGFLLIKKRRHQVSLI
jgi:hypothetical protein